MYRKAPSFRTPIDNGAEPRLTSGDDQSASLPSIAGVSALHALSMRSFSAAITAAHAAVQHANSISALRHRRLAFFRRLVIVLLQFRR
jgi:hypothetical protein